MRTFVRFSALTVALAFFLAPLRAASDQPGAVGLRVPNGFSIEAIARVSSPRELSVAPNGDLFVGTGGGVVDIITAPESAAPGSPQIFARFEDHPMAGVAVTPDSLYVGGQFGVYRLAYRSGERVASAPPAKIASVRTSGTSGSHRTTTVALTGGVLYASVGSSCNNCQPEVDDTRATIQQMRPDGSDMKPRAVHIRNAIALAVNPETGSLWAGVAGQDELAHGHPYEIVDDISAHGGVADYGWPYCYENRIPVDPGHDCANIAVPRVVLPAYQTPIGATFYPLHASGRYAFPSAYRGGLFVSAHGSWHQPPVPPRVFFVAMNGDAPRTPVNWHDPTTQWSEFLGGFQQADGSRIGRPTGIAVGSEGSLFVADDQSGAIYRIRPTR